MINLKNIVVLGTALSLFHTNIATADITEIKKHTHSHMTHHHKKKRHRKFNPLKVVRNPFVYITRGFSSWYGPGFQGLKTASGIRFNMYAPMCAMRYVKLGTWVHIKNLNTGLSTSCLIADRGPYVAGRIIDVSYAVRNAIGMRGLAPVEIWI